MERIKAIFKKADYSWVIIALCFVIVLTSLGLCSSGRTLYLTAITEALGIPRSAFSLNDTFRFVTTTIVNLFFGVLVQKFGSKKLICAGFLCLIAFAVINSLASSLIWFYLGGILLGIGLSWTTTTMVSMIVNRWCKENKATITGAILAANGLGGAIAVQILSPIIFMEGNPFGYRISYRLVACVLVVVFVLILFLYRDPPKAEDSAVTTTKKKKPRGAGWVGMPFQEVIRKPYFYLTLLCIFFIGMALHGMGGIGVPYMYDLGMDVEFVSVIVSMGSLLLFCTKFLTGLFYDRFGMKIAMNIGLFAILISMSLLILMDNSFFGKIIAVCRSVIGSFGTPLETVMIPIFVTEFFGNKDFDKLIGIVASVNYAGFGIGAPLGNLFYDLLGGYRWAFALFAVLMVFSTVSLQFVLKAANRDRQKILAALEEQQAATAE